MNKNMNIPDLQHPDLERLLYQPPLQTMPTGVALHKGDVDAAALFSEVRSAKAALSAHIRRSL